MSQVREGRRLIRNNVVNPDTNNEGMAMLIRDSVINPRADSEDVAMHVKLSSQ